MYITDLLSRSLENSALDVTLRAVNALAEQYNFPAEEAIAYLNLEKLSLNRKQLAKKTSGMKEARGAGKVKSKAEKLGFSLPFCGVIAESGCSGLKYDSGLFTQCTGTRGEEGFCKGCMSQMSKSGSSFPDCGTVGQRLAVEAMEYQDPKGRKPVAYAKYMEKKGLNIDKVMEAAGKLGITIPQMHFEMPVKKVRAPSKGASVDDSKKRGRPKKEAKVVESSSVDDLFDNLAKEASSPRAEVVEEVVEEVVVEEVVVEDESASKSDDESASSKPKKEKKEKKAKMSDAEKAELAAMKEVEKEQKKVAADAEKLLKKEAAEAEKLAKKEAAEAEKLLKKAAAEAEKQQKKVAAEAEKLAKKEAAEAEKLLKPKATEKAKKSKAAEKPAMIGGGGGGGGGVQEEPAAKKKVTVTKFTFEGNSYLRSAEGVVYDAETKDDVGMWNETTKEVDFFEEEDELEAEESEDDDA